MTAIHINDLLSRRLKHGLTTAKRVQLAAGLNVDPISAIAAEFIDTQADIKAPQMCEKDIRKIGQYLFDARVGPECTSRFALVCAEALFPHLPRRLKARCCRILTLAYAYLAVPTQQELAQVINRQRERLRDPWTAWLQSGEIHTDAGKRASDAYCGFGLCITAVLENMDVSPGMRFMITESAQEAGWAACGDEQVFWTAMRRDLLPWLIGGPLPVQAATPSFPPKPSKDG